MWHRDCFGNECLARQSARTTDCLLRGFGVQVDAKNLTRRDSCGLKTEDAHWLEPSVAVASKQGKNGEPRCSSANPAGVEIEYWVDCVDGELEHRFNIKFVSGWQPGDYRYSCIASPTCVDKVYLAAIICYKNVREMHGLGPNEESDMSLEVDDLKSGHSGGVTLRGIGFGIGLVHIIILLLFP